MATEAHAGLLKVEENPRSLARPEAELGPFKEGCFSEQVFPIFGAKGDFPRP